MTDEELKMLETMGHDPRLIAEVRRLRSEALHWTRVAMAEAGFSADVIAAVTSAPRPLEPEETDALRRLADDWAKRRGLSLTTQPTAPRGPTCDDCRATGQCLITKSDHHGGTKTVCADRDACHERERAPSPTVPATCATCGGTRWLRVIEDDSLPCPDCAGRAK